jgi:putative glutamine amidotransferase
MSRLPLTGIAECSKQNGPHACHDACHVSDPTNVRATATTTSGSSAISASLTKPLSASDILDGADGTPVTVTPFNIEPIHNGGLAFARHASARDSARPARTVHLIENTIACR